MSIPPPPPAGLPRDHQQWRELVATALVERLPADLAAAVDGHLAACPSCRREQDELAAVAAALEVVDAGAVTTAAPVPPPGLEDRIVQASRVVDLPRRRPRMALPAVAASLVLLAAIALGTLLGRGEPAAPGTLGAVEVVEVSTAEGITAEVSVVAHTWGTELVLVLDGTTDPRAHQVAVEVDGRQVGAGSFLGTDVTVLCRMNAAVLREDVDRLVITGPDGTTILEGALPEV